MMSCITNEQLTERPRESSESTTSINIDKKVIQTKIRCLEVIFVLRVYTCQF